ncbi:hypothetical protein Rleg9DRAFT_2119 [Rhizobium leguminosarum bv. trifolii WSM597]|uniref:Uncharacterized protein n=1 Tax=Rhizobium leguminosarum bv. trifolii WSM597 TaxID=754764 RepID=I9N998_RHILT|nr:hypothetical protein Rleg9DRAFT_2119 [Rhizobium leguminosarum bv. trifolii WSM597]
MPNSNLTAPARCWNCSSISPPAGHVLPISVMLGLDPSIHAKALCLQMFFGRMPSPFGCECGHPMHQKREAGLSPGLFRLSLYPNSVRRVQLDREEQRLA